MEGAGFLTETRRRLGLARKELHHTSSDFDADCEGTRKLLMNLIIIDHLVGGLCRNMEI